MNVIPEERLSPAQIGQMQEESWRETFRYVGARSPFYREHFRRAGLSIQQPPPLGELGAIAPVDKTVLTEHAAAFLCVPASRIVDVVTTSGATGQPLVVMLTEADMERVARNEELSFRCAGFSAQDTVLLAVTLDRCFLAGMAYALGLRRLGCTVVRVGPATPLLHVDMLRRTRANAVVGVPSLLSLLADRALESGADLSTFGVRKAACTGEAVRQGDFTLNRTGSGVQRRWLAKVFSIYGVTELATSLCECEAGCGAHLHPEMLFLEALDDEGRAVPDGQVGELTATTFGVEGMPLIRYRTGDYAAIHRGPCACGRHTLRIGPIVGRRHQKLKLKGTSVFPSALKGVLDATPQVVSYVIIARRDSELSDAVEVQIACSEDPAEVCRHLRQRFQGEVKVSPQITVATAREIEALRMPEGAPRRRYFVDLRQ